MIKIDQIRGLPELQAMANVLSRDASFKRALEHHLEESGYGAYHRHGYDAPINFKGLEEYWEDTELLDAVVKASSPAVKKTWDNMWEILDGDAVQHGWERVVGPLLVAAMKRAVPNADDIWRDSFDAALEEERNARDMDETEDSLSRYAARRVAKRYFQRMLKPD